MDKQAPQQDTIYQTYDRGFYKITGEESFDNIMDALGADPGANNSTMVNVPSDIIGSGQGTSNVSQSTGAYESGKESFGDDTPGFFLGIDTDGVAKFSIGNGTSFVQWNGSTLTVLGGVSVSSLDIPDTTSPNSFHVDSSGNTWWGANVASGIGAANAAITNAGAAVFKNVAIGGVQTQYVITNSGIFSYGDGSDGSATISGNTSLVRDMYYTTLTINSGVTLTTNGFRIFCSLSATINGTIDNSGGNGTAGQDGIAVSGSGGTSRTTPGSAGSQPGTGYCGGPGAGSGGGFGSQGNGNNETGGTAGVAVANSLGAAGAAGGNGGKGADVSGGFGSGGTGGVASTSSVKLIANWHLATLLDITSTGATLKFTPGGGAGGGGGGNSAHAFSNGPAGGAGGGGAGGGGIVSIYAKVIVIGASGVIQANGGTGGNGGNGTNDGVNGSGGGGGGGGGNGGVVILVYNSITNSGSILCNPGAGGTGGAAGGGSTRTGQAGSNGTTGSAGSIYQFSLSL